MNSTTTTTDGLYPVKYFRYLSPINLALAVYIMIQNSMVIYDYSKDWKRLSSCLFILIAAVDIGSAFCELARGSVALLCLHDESMKMETWIYVTYITLGLLCYVTSTFFGMVLTVVKTINIVNPFYRIPGRVLKTCLALFPIIGFVIFVVDTWLMCSDSIYNLFNPAPCQFGPWMAMFYIQLVGQEMLYELSQGISYPVLIFFEFGLPCLIVLICMVLQIVYVKRALGESADPRQANANHVTITIFLISLLYFLSVSVYFAFLFYEMNYAQFNFQFVFKSSLGILMMVAKYTLPLLNAALFPTILILRKPDLTARYRGYVGTVLLIPVSIFYHIRSRRRGYTDI